jgi:hypothetical protein
MVVLYLSSVTQHSIILIFFFMFLEIFSFVHKDFLLVSFLNVIDVFGALFTYFLTHIYISRY